MLFNDTFLEYNEPKVGMAATLILERAGFEVILPPRQICCGRPLISRGFLRQAREQARANVELLAPFAEEAFFRGYALRFLVTRGGAWLGVAVSSVLFAVVHFHLPLFPVYLAYGVLFAWLYRRTSRLTTPVIAHVTVNLVGLVLLWATSGTEI